MIDPAIVRLPFVLADLTLQATSSFLALCEALLRPFDPLGAPPAGAARSPPPAEPLPAAAADVQPSNRAAPLEQAPRRSRDAVDPPPAAPPLDPPPPAPFPPAPFPTAPAPTAPAPTALAPIREAAAPHERPRAPNRRPADLVVYRVPIAIPASGVPRRDTALGRAASLEAVVALGLNTLHLVPAHGGVFRAGALDDYAVRDVDEIAALLPALRTAVGSPLTPAALRMGESQFACLVDAAHRQGLSVLIDLEDEPRAAACAAMLGADGMRLRAPHDRANASTPGSLVWGGRRIDAASDEDVRTALRDLLRGLKTDGARPFADLAAALTTPGIAGGLHALAGVDDIEDLATLADPQAPRDWPARSRLRLATTLLLSAPGAPVLAAGQEFFAPGTAEAVDRVAADALRFTRAAVAMRAVEPGLRGAGLRVARADAESRVLVLHRWVADGSAGRDVIVVANCSGTTLHEHRVGLPRGGWWREIFNSDAFESDFDRPTIGNGGAVDAHDGPLDGFAHSVPMTVPPNGVLVFTPCS